MKVLIVDDEAPARDSLILLCERSDDIQVVGEAACGMAAIDAAGKLDPDLMLLNVAVSDMSGFALLRTMRGGALILWVSWFRRAPIRRSEHSQKVQSITW